MGVKTKDNIAKYWCGKGAVAWGEGADSPPGDIPDEYYLSWWGGWYWARERSGC